MVLYCTYDERAFAKRVKARWSGQLKAWVLEPSVITYIQVKELAKNLDLDLDIDVSVSDAFEARAVELENIKSDIKFKTEPRTYQLSMTRLAVTMGQVFFFTEVGTGKTKAAIDTVTALWAVGVVRRVLVISPKGIMRNFANEVEIHSHFDATILSGPISRRKRLLEESNAVFDIVNYDVIGKLSDELVKKGYCMVILDEVHYCKNRNSSRSKATEIVTRDIKRRIGMSGTIICNNYEDLFMPYKIVSPEIFGPHWTRFKDRYLIMNELYKSKVEDYVREDELKGLISRNSIYLKIRDVVKDLPPENIVIKQIDLSDKSMKMYKSIKNDMFLEYEGGEIVAPNVLERILRLSQITSGYLVDKELGTTTVIGDEKIEVLESILTEISEKCVIFCRFRASIDRVADLCEKLGLGYYIYDGRTKDALYLQFNDDDTPVFIAQLQKSEGYSLPSARYCIFFEMDYSRKNHVQAKGRILRASGSTHDSIFYYYLLCRDTIDEVVYETLKEKDFLSEEAMALVRRSE